MEAGLENMRSWVQTQGGPNFFFFFFSSILFLLFFNALVISYFIQTDTKCNKTGHKVALKFFMRYLLFILVYFLITSILAWDPYHILEFLPFFQLFSNFFSTFFQLFFNFFSTFFQLFKKFLKKVSTCSQHVPNLFPIFPQLFPNFFPTFSQLFSNFFQLLKIHLFSTSYQLFSTF